MFKLFFATPDKKIVSDLELEEITLPAAAGELNILPGHAPLMTTLEAGTLKYKLKNGESDQLAISWGYCQVSGDGVSVLAETAVHANEIDANASRSKLKSEEEKMMNEILSDEDWSLSMLNISKLRAEIELSNQK